MVLTTWRILCLLLILISCPARIIVNAQSQGQVIKNIFLLKKIKRNDEFSLARKCIAGGGWGEFIKFLLAAADQSHLIFLQVKLDNIPNISPQTGCSAKFAFRFQRGSKWEKSAIFAICFWFFDYTRRTIYFRRKLLPN